jgi:hypothetical protein
VNRVDVAEIGRQDRHSRAWIIAIAIGVEDSVDRKAVSKIVQPLFDIVLSHGDVVWIDDLAAHDGEIAARVGDLILSAGKIIPIGNDQVGELAYLDTSLLASWCSS